MNPERATADHQNLLPPLVLRAEVEAETAKREDNPASENTPLPPPPPEAGEEKTEGGKGRRVGERRTEGGGLKEDGGKKEGEGKRREEGEKKETAEGKKNPGRKKPSQTSLQRMSKA